MSSPFSTIEEFNGALDGPTEGAIYTFANAPMINIIALLASVGVFLWFIVKTYSTHTKPSSADQALNQLSTFIVVSLLSLFAAEIGKPARFEPQNRSASLERVKQSSRRPASLGLFGLTGLGLPMAGTSMFRQGRRFYRGRRRKRIGRNR